MTSITSFPENFPFMFFFYFFKNQKHSVFKRCFSRTLPPKNLNNFSTQTAFLTSCSYVLPMLNSAGCPTSPFYPAGNGSQQGFTPAYWTAPTSVEPQKRRSFVVGTLFFGDDVTIERELSRTGKVLRNRGLRRTTPKGVAHEPERKSKELRSSGSDFVEKDLRTRGAERPSVAPLPRNSSYQNQGTT